MIAGYIIKIKRKKKMCLDETIRENEMGKIYMEAIEIKRK